MTKRIKAVVVGAFVLALGAGTLMGVGVGRYSAKPATPPPPRSQLATELQLTAEQQKQMAAIWSEAMQTGGPSYMERRKSLQEERDAAIAELLPPALLAGYDKILDRYREKLDALGQERDKAFADAESRTQAVLTPDQQKTYLAIMQRRDGNHRGGVPDGKRGGRGSATTAPRDGLQVDRPRP